MQTINQFSKLVVVLGCTLGATSAALAVPYASGVRNTGGANWEFVLNESADIVTITRDGGNPLVINNAAVGRHMFDMTGFTNFEIAVSKAAPVAWTELSDPANLFTKFERPVGLAVNRDPSSPYFGTIYVGQSTNLPTAAAGGGSIPARTMAEGIYPLTADRIGVDLSTFAAIADPQSTAQSKRPSAWVTDDTPGTGGTGASNDNARSPWRFSLDADGNLIVADWSLTAGGMKWASPDLSMGGALLAVQDGELDGGFPIRNSQDDDLHSRITSRPYVTGAIGDNLTVTAFDALLEVVPDATTADRLNVWRWNIGNHDVKTSPYDGTNLPPQTDLVVPDLVFQGNKLAGQPNINGSTLITSVPGVLVNMSYSPQHDLYYVTQPRSNGTEASLMIVDANLDVDPTGQTPILKWSSLDWTRDNGLDGCVLSTGTACGGATYAETDGEDIFRMTGFAEVSADGSSLFIRRQQVMGNATGTAVNENPHMGLSSNVPWAVVEIPLDANGLPVVVLDGMGTPEKADDEITNFTGFQTASPGSAPANHELTFDIAGNAYTTHSSAELLQVFSPGGNTTAITTSSGMFSIVPFVPPVGGVTGDYNDDGKVDAADFVVWRKFFGTNTQLENEGDGVTPGMVTTEDYDVWVKNFGNAAAPGLGFGAAVPEPATMALVLLALSMFGAVRRR